jgi:3-oxoacyl-[acyl-carrier protein] reductase
MNLELDGKVALVTGSSRGIGADIALGLASEGCDLILTGRDTAALSDIANTIRSKGRRASICIADLRQPSAATALVDLIQEDFGKLDILVNCAGAAKRGLFLELNDDDWADGFALKFFAHVRLSRAVWMLLQQSRGSVVMIGGTSGRIPHADYAIGSAVNAAQAAFGKALADLGKSDGVQVNTVHLGHIDTDRLVRRVKVEMDRKSRSEDEVRREFRQKAGINRFGTAMDVADLVAFIVSKRATWLHGATIDLDGGEIPAL